MRTIDWRAITPQDLSDSTDDVWEAMYSSVEELLDLATDLLKREFHAYSQESGKDRLATWGVRKKDKKSFVNKMRMLRGDKHRHEEKLPAGGAGSIFTLVNDLIGGRLVFYFERDIQEAILFWLGYPAYRPIEVTQWAQDMSGYDSALPTSAWLRMIPGVKKPPKPSGYESLHMILKFDPMLLEARRFVWAAKSSKAKGSKSRGSKDDSFDWDKISEKKLRQHRRDLSEITFEVQCRTVLEHTWAEVEHKARYSPVKSSQTLVSSLTSDVTEHKQTEAEPDELRRRFRNYKAILRSAQIFQNSIRVGFGLWDSDREAVVGASAGVDIGPRDRFWPEPEQGVIHAFDESIKGAFATVRDKKFVPDKTKPEPWMAVMSRFDAMLQMLAPRSPDPTRELLHIGTELSLQEYGRRRLLVMLVGFVLGHAWYPGKRSREGVEGQDTAQRVASRLYEQANLGRDPRGIIPPRIMTVRLYEHLRILDEWFAARHRKDLFRDPLVPVRAASAHYRHFGSFRRAAKLLEEAYERLEDWRRHQPNPPPILQRSDVAKRITESYWTAYQLEGRQREDLDAARTKVLKAIDDLDGDRKRGSQVAPDMDQKILALWLTIELYVCASEVCEGRMGGAEEGWSILAKLREVVNLRSAEIARCLGSATMKDSSLRLQGAAIWLAARAARPDGATPKKQRRNQNRYLVEARQKIRESRRLAFDALRSGAGLQMHLDVSREVENFIFSLCSDDLEKEMKADVDPVAKNAAPSPTDRRVARVSGPRKARAKASRRVDRSV